MGGFLERARDHVVRFDGEDDVMEREPPDVCWWGVVRDSWRLDFARVDLFFDFAGDDIREGVFRHRVACVGAAMGHLPVEVGVYFSVLFDYGDVIAWEFRAAIGTVRRVVDA